jgi:hypothetical protein
LAQPACVRPQPIRALSGWIHLGEVTRDAWVGAYHDAQSGAFVQYEYQSTDKPTVLAEAGDKVKDGTVGGRKFQMWQGADARGRVKRAYDRLTQNQVSEGPNKWIDELLPPAGTSMVIVSFSGPGMPSWVFNAAVDGARQRERVEELLLTGDPFERVASDSECKADGLTTVQIAAVKKIKSNQDVATVRNALGAENWARRDGTRGFVIGYSLAGNERRLTGARLTFGQSQQLRRMNYARADP